MFEKKVMIVNGMTGTQTPVKLCEGATPQDVLHSVGLGNHQLARVRGRQLLPRERQLAPMVHDGEHLYAFMTIEVGNRGFFRSLARLIRSIDRMATRTRAAEEPPWDDLRQRILAADAGLASDISSVLHRGSLPARSGRVQVLRTRRGDHAVPYWQLRGWRQKGDGLYVGHFRTPFGRHRGTIKFVSRYNFAFYIEGAPRAILSGPKGACFRPVRPNKFEIHFTIAPRDVNSGIFYVETLLTEAQAHG